MNVISREHLIIHAYDKAEGNRVQGEIDTFTVDFNPNTFTVVNKIDYKTPEAKGAAGAEPQFAGIPPIEFSIEFTLDGTGVAAQGFPKPHADEYQNEKTDYVKNKIKQLRGVTGTRLNGDIHRPNYLAVQWGTFDIKCVIVSLNIVYNLFHQTGSPLRAKITCNFIERSPPGATTRSSQLESPDLTKQLVIKEGDMLHLISKDNYNSSSYYLQIAKANKLKNFRRMIPGMKIFLPPMADKDE